MSAEELREVAAQLRGCVETAAAEGRADSLETFAAEADRLADSLEAGEAVPQAQRKLEQFSQLIELFMVAHVVENQDEALQEAEEKLRRTATELRALAGRGSSPVFTAIATIAEQAEAGLAEFLAADDNADKWQAFAKVEEAKEQWHQNMTKLQEEVGAAVEADRRGPAAPAPAASCEYVADPDAGCTPYEATGQVDDLFASFGIGQTLRASTLLPGQAPMPPFSPEAAAAASTTTAEVPLAQAAVPPSSPEAASAASTTTVAPALVPPSSPAEARKQIVDFLSDPEEGLLVSLRKTVAAVKADARFEHVHEDAEKMLEQMELAVGAVLPDMLPPADFSDDVAGAEDRLKANMEPMRKAQWGGFYASRAAWQVRKYDAYKSRRLGTPKLEDEHPELLECALATTQVAEFLRKEAQGAMLDSVTGLVAQAMTAQPSLGTDPSA